MQWHPIDRAEVARIHARHMKRDFPPDELKPLAMLYHQMAKGNYWPHACYDADGALLAYAFLCGLGEGGPVLLDYYAVTPALRGKGMGTLLLEQLREVCAGRWSGILIESEEPAAAPDPVQAEHRLDFYRRAGCRELSWQSIVYKVWYRLFYLDCGDADPGPAGDEALAGTLAELYRRTLLRPNYEKNVRFFPAGQHPD